MRKGDGNEQDRLMLPNSPFVATWAILFSLTIIAYLGSAVFEIGFQTKANQLFNSAPQTAVLLCFCLVDTAMYINIGIILNGKLVKNRYNNLLNYVQSSLFVTDSIVLLVLLVRFSLGLTQNQLQYSLTLSILDLVVCLKFFNFRKYNQLLTFYYFDDWSLLLYEFVKHIILLALLCHVVACAFFLIDVSLIEAAWYPLEEHWLISAQAMPGLYYASLPEQYLYSFYFSIVTLSTMAYGDITPLNPTEVAFVLCILAFLLMFYVYIFTQIYEVVNWFNRKSIQIQEERHKIAHFLKRFEISADLSGRIVSEYEFREREAQETNKEQFINDLSSKLAKSYSSMPYKLNINKFMPRFIKAASIQSGLFHGALTEKFFTPEEKFGPIQFNNERVERTMYFVNDRPVYRSLVYGSSKLTELAEKERWLGINAFLTSQADPNELWQVETPTELIALSFHSLEKSVKPMSANYERLLEHCHRVLYAGGMSEDMNKCLVCWKEHHSSKYCIEYRPEVRKENGRLLRKTSRLNQIRRMIKETEINKRQPVNRHQRRGTKIQKGQPLIIPMKSVAIQADLLQKEKGSFLNLLRSRAQETVRDWPHYMRDFNMPKYENLVGVPERQLMVSLIQSLHP